MNTWHASDEMLDSYTRGESTIAVTASVEAHVMRCPVCRDRIAATDTTPQLGAIWTRIAGTIETPKQPLVVRLLRRFGVSEPDAIVLAAARSLSDAWVLAMVAVISFAAVAAVPTGPRAATLYLIVAPLVPVVGVVAAFASTDPLADLTESQPYSKARLALLRSLAVVITSVPLTIAIGLAVPGIALLAFAWLLPSLALTLITLVGMTWWDPEPIGTAAGIAWVVVIGVAYGHHDVAGAVRPALQLVYLALAMRVRSARTPGGYA